MSGKPNKMPGIYLPPPRRRSVCDEPVPSPVYRVCRVCGCTDDDCLGCIERTGEACWWIDDDLCSACQEPRS